MDDNKRIMEEALEFLKDILADLQEFLYIFLIINPDGVIKYSFSNGITLPYYCKPGYNWSEKHIGYTGAALAMKTKEMSLVTYKEHTEPGLQDFFSLAAPFQVPKAGNPGYIVLLSDSREMIPFAKGVVRACVRFLEGQLQNDAMLKDAELQNKFVNTIINTIHDGFLVLYPDGIITHANNKAAAMLGTRVKDIIGHKLSEFVLSDLRVLEIFKTGQPIIDCELFVKLRNRSLHIVKTAVPIHDEQGKVIAVIDNFKEFKDVHRLVNKMVGAKAIYTFESIIYTSKEMKETISIAEAASRSSLAVLIQGESGTGKELFAHAIHNASVRKNNPFVIIDCATIPRELVESELFGYIEGAFTGANRGGKVGKFELANGGTVFLDEIGEIPLELQTKFLRVLQSQAINRVGGTENIPIDIRIIAATNRNLQEQVRLGNFREDLYYRLNVLNINIPPLRARPEDIRILAEYFLAKDEIKLGKKGLRFSEKAMELLQTYTWPGNVRELENAVVRAITLSEGLILPGHLPAGIYEGVQQPLKEAFPAIENYCMSFEEMEKRSIEEALRSCQGNRVKAAQLLGIARSTLYRKMELYKIT